MCVHACVRECMRACVLGAYVCARARLCVCLCVQGECECVRARVSEITKNEYCLWKLEVFKSNQIWF